MSLLVGLRPLKCMFSFRKSHHHQAFNKPPPSPKTVIIIQCHHQRFVIIIVIVISTVSMNIPPEFCKWNLGECCCSLGSCEGININCLVYMIVAWNIQMLTTPPSRLQLILTWKIIAKQKSTMFPQSLTKIFGKHSV